jgi:cation-transporting ATPase E
MGDAAVTAWRGLTAADIAARIADGTVNRTTDRPSRTVGEIVRANVFTRFNAVIAALMAVVLALGEWRDSLFGVVMVLNVLIGVVQEWRAKSTLDRLSLVSAPTITVWRDGRQQQVASEDVVIDEVFELSPGDQIVVDAEILRSDGLTVDESLLTGESDAVDKDVGAQVKSGSFVTAGGAVARATAVGDDSYAARLTAEAKQFRAPKSETAKGIDRIIGFITWAIVPAAVMLYFGQRASEDESMHDTLVGVVAGVVALVPQGLILLLSMAQAVAVIRLGRKQVLVQRLQAVETLARVTVLASDKTGTLTTGAVTLETIESLDNHVGEQDRAERIDVALAAVAAADEFPNATMQAIRAARPDDPGWSVTRRIRFDSAHKYSAVEFDSGNAWYVGAPEILANGVGLEPARIEQLARQGLRVLLLAQASELRDAGELPDDLTPTALLVLTDEVRPDASDTVDYFLRENVRPKVISGDNPVTVAAIARRCNVPNADRYVDARDLPDDPVELAEVADRTAVFGRVTPEAKRSLLHALQARGEVVAMTGDGVNDTLALKDADLGIAVGAGTPAAKSVSDLVLLDNRFATLPSVVAEGRRVIANIERVARLFLTKTAWAAVLAVLTGVLMTRYPMRPRHLTVVDSLTIGIPGFVLSFQPSHEPVRPGFIRRVLRFSIPAGLVSGVATMSIYELGTGAFDLTIAHAQSGATLTLVGLGLWVLYELARPLDQIRVVLIATLTALAFATFAIPFVADFFLLEVPPAGYAAAIAGVVAASATLITVALHVVGARADASPAGSDVAGGVEGPAQRVRQDPPTSDRGDRDDAPRVAPVGDERT